MRGARVRLDLTWFDLYRVAIRQGNGQYLTIIVNQYTLDPTFDRLALGWHVWPKGLAGLRPEVVGRRNDDMLRAIILGDPKDALARESAPGDPGVNMPHLIIVHD